MIQSKKGGLDFYFYDDDQGTLGTWFIDIHHYDTEHDQLQSLIRAWWVHWIQYPHHDLKINEIQNFDQGQFEQGQWGQQWLINSDNQQ